MFLVVVCILFMRSARALSFGVMIEDILQEESVVRSGQVIFRDENTQRHSCLRHFTAVILECSEHVNEASHCET